MATVVRIRARSVVDSIMLCGPVVMGLLERFADSPNFIPRSASSRQPTSTITIAVAFQQDT